MDKKRFKSDRERFKHLDTFLSYPPNGWHPSIWGLQTYLNESDKVDPPRSVYIDYDFVSCDNYFEIMELKALYQTLLRSADHLELHEACIQGKLWSFATSHIQVNPRFESKMRNSYPLPFPYKYSGLQISRPLTVRFSQQQLESLSDNFLLSADGIIVDGGPGGGEKHVIRLPPWGSRFSIKEMPYTVGLVEVSFSHTEYVCHVIWFAYEIMWFVVWEGWIYVELRCDCTRL